MPVSALANRRFLKMNGLGNEIVVVDLRGAADRVSRRGGARRRGRPALALRPAHDHPRAAHARHQRLSRASTTRTAPNRAPAATARAASPGLFWTIRVMARPSGQSLLLETKAGLLPVARVSDATPLPSTWARRACAGTRFPCANLSRTPAISNCRSVRSMRRSCTRPRSSAWATRMRCSGWTTSMPTTSPASDRCSKTTRSSPSAPTSRSRR